MKQTTLKDTQYASFLAMNLKAMEVSNLDELELLFREYFLRENQSTLLTTIQYFSNISPIFIHKSFLNQSKIKGLSSNERLEFLGDSILSAIVSNEIIRRFPEMPEGDCSKFRASLVNADSLSLLAEFLGLSVFLIMGKGETLERINENTNAKCDVFEALIGKVFQERGFEDTQKFFFDVIKRYEESTGVGFFDHSKILVFDYKSKLQEKTMSLYKIHPVYQSTEIETGEFEVAITLDGKKLASMRSNSKKNAQKLLAKKIYEEKTYLIRGENHAH